MLICPSLLAFQANQALYALCGHAVYEPAIRSGLTIVVTALPVTVGYFHAVANPTMQFVGEKFNDLTHALSFYNRWTGDRCHDCFDQLHDNRRSNRRRIWLTCVNTE
jgi:hypothetical protein